MTMELHGMTMELYGMTMELHGAPWNDYGAPQYDYGAPWNGLWSSMEPMFKGGQPPWNSMEVLHGEQISPWKQYGSWDLEIFYYGVGLRNIFTMELDLENFSQWSKT